MLQAASHPKPLFPQTLHNLQPLPCPRIPRPSSVLSRRICFYIHEWLLKPLSTAYCRFRGIRTHPSIYPLPFGLLLKNGPRVREQEGIAMNLARAMGVPAPRFISFAEPPSGHVFSGSMLSPMPSLLMTRLPGIELDAFSNEDIDFDLVKDDLVRILTLMRSFSSPWGASICGVDGGPVAGPLIPLSQLPASTDEAAFYQQIRYIGNFAAKDKKDVAPAEQLFAHPTHAVVFTHGDLNPHNIMVGPDGHVCGIFDWESAGWLPDYWEVSVTAILPRVWGQFMNERVTSGVYTEEVQGHRSMFPHISDSLSY
ncbi:hypothetical protein DICSQDRAFT_106729 [Dichomitus squalens LYAD-421 SS1]|uniref:Aminoglycoside phosphotransferase domain-containing protein n=1 Tax=Dichomitus squalens (strain LYAD-421) TaxID=732165 RepID=R7SY91_DICSQ|nr:uncharacterized protein DICSQDRAFT_106729 [Dichomitus squalens LYAD-421 SS1]EJF61061.1 hypothetical protein DICSQDRAFT_106729 [Dichomitus squalens LYAD-421 SS1]